MTTRKPLDYNTVSVQPMTQPISLIFYLDYRYGKQPIWKQLELFETK